MAGKSGAVTVMVPTFWPCAIGAVRPGSVFSTVFSPAWESTCMVTATACAGVTGTLGCVPSVTGRLPHHLVGGGDRIAAEFAERHVHHPAGFLGALDVGEIVIVVLGIAQSVENQDEALYRPRLAEMVMP